MAKYEINTGQRKSAFIATILHESGEFKYTREIASGEAYEGRKDLGNIFTKVMGEGLGEVRFNSAYRQNKLL